MRVPTVPQAWAQNLFLFSVIWLIVWLLVRAWRYQRHGAARHSAYRSTISRQVASARQNVVAPPELARWQVELHDQARDLIGQIDSKLVLLHQLVQAADSEARRLESLLERTGRQEPQPDTLAGPHRRRGEETALPVRTGLNDSTSRTRATPHAEIIELSRAGVGAEDIARQLDVPSGEVELVLNLRAAR